MRTTNLVKKTIVVAAALSMSGRAAAQYLAVKNLPGRSTAPNLVEPLYTPTRAPALLDGAEEGKSPELHFDPATGNVTVKMAIPDSNGNFLPNIRRDNFAVYENGVRQRDATVEIEHAPVSVTVLMEWGGRYLSLNKALGDEVPRAAQQLLERITGGDQIALFKYGERADALADFSAARNTLGGLLTGLKKPAFSELNLYDALISTVESMKGINGRKAIVLISSGIDTFSRAKYEDVLTAARQGGTPVYVIDIGPDLRKSWERVASKGGPYARIDWNRAASQLQEIAKNSGGHLYSIDSTFDMADVYDDLMEKLRVRYVITYKPKSDGADRSAARTVRIDLIDPTTGGPLEILDASGKPVPSKLSVFENRYTPTTAAVASLDASARDKKQ